MESGKVPKEESCPVKRQLVSTVRKTVCKSSEQKSLLDGANEEDASSLIKTSLQIRETLCKPSISGSTPDVGMKLCSYNFGRYLCFV